MPAPKEPPTITVSFGTRAVETAATIFAPSLAIPPCSYLEPTMKPLTFWTKTSGMRRWSQSWTKWAPFRALSEKRMPLLATRPTGWPSMWAKAQTRVLPYFSLNSRSSPPSTTRRRTSRMSQGAREPIGTTSRIPSGSSTGGRGSIRAQGGAGSTGRVATISRRMLSASASSAARWSATPDLRAWTSPPPSSSAVTSSPVAAFTSGGPPRKIVPWWRTITVSSLIAGT